MKALDEYLEQHFGGAREGGRRMAAASEVHAVHESGFDVHYTRYSVTYRDARGERVYPAELDEDGVLVIRSSGEDPAALERIAIALDFLDVKHERR